MIFTLEASSGECPSTSSTADDTAARSVSSSLTSPAWWRVVAHILADRVLLACDMPTMVRHNSATQTCKRESSLNFKWCSSSEDISHHAPSPDASDKWQNFSLATSRAWCASASSPSRRATLRMRPSTSSQTNASTMTFSTCAPKLTPSVTPAYAYLIKMNTAKTRMGGDKETQREPRTHRQTFFLLFSFKTVL
jgi:hypothetical protein